MELLTTVGDYLNANPGFVVALGGLLGVVVQYALNRFVELGKLTNYLVGLIALPGITTAGAAYISTLHLTPGTVAAVGVVGQLFYASWEAIQRHAEKKAAQF